LIPVAKPIDPAGVIAIPSIVTSPRPCDVVGVIGEHDDLRFVVIVRGRSSAANTVSEVRRRSPTLEPL
jgi:hypothetical protein